MLEHVTANQTRFMAPGLSSDSRGVALGRFLALLLPSLDRVVGLFRGLSERMSLDDVMSALKVYQVKTPLQSREFIVQVPVVASHTADGVAAVTALMGGLTFTGSSKHFIRYRDGRSPLGYDVDSLHADQGDFILYDTSFVQAYRREREIPFAQLALNLSLQLERGDRLQDDETIIIRAVPGLWRAVVGYLHRSKLRCEVAACERASSDERPAESFYLVRGQIARRMESLFRRTPGLELHRMFHHQVAVQLGYRHPMVLSSCASIFDQGRFYLFSGARNRLDVLAASPSFVSADALLALSTSEGAIEVSALTSRPAERLDLTLRLVYSSSSPQAVVAARVPREQVAWLKKLVYLLPPQALSGISVCITEEAVFVHSDSALEFIPLGQLYQQIAPGVMVPVGHELLPRVSPEVLVQHLANGGETLTFFTPERGPERLPRSAFAPLSRQALAPVEVVEPTVQAPAERGGTEPQLCNEPLGLFPLWGFTDGGEER